MAEQAEKYPIYTVHAEEGLFWIDCSDGWKSSYVSLAAMADRPAEFALMLVGKDARIHALEVENAALRQRKTVPEGMTAEKLRKLADWLDDISGNMVTGWPENVRRWADELEFGANILWAVHGH